MTDSLSEQFGQIYDQYIGKIYRFVYIKVSSQEIAEDITSKVFIKAWKAFNGSKGRIDNPGAFLYQIAKNSVIDHYRAKERDKTVSVDASPEIVDPEQGAHEMAALNADVDVIKKAIQKLQKDQQDIIIWHYLDDMSIDEIAELLHKPAGTIRVALHRGIKALKEIIEGQAVTK